MITFGVDAHKRTHTVVAVDDLGRQQALTTVQATSEGHLAALRWAGEIAGDEPTRWAIEDCRHVSRRLEADLLAVGATIVRVPPTLMAEHRRHGRQRGKSDPIDALAVARAALREPDLPVARLEGPDRDIRLLVDRREQLVADRTAEINRLRWHLHELEPELEQRCHDFTRRCTLARVEAALRDRDGVVARIARAELARCQQLTSEINALESELRPLVAHRAPTLQRIVGVGVLNAAKIIGETAGIDRFPSAAAYACHNGTAPRPTWSGDERRHRLSRGGNRQLNAVIHRIFVTQRRCYPPANALYERRRTDGKTKGEARRIVKRHISNAIYQALRADGTNHLAHAA